MRRALLLFLGAALAVLAWQSARAMQVSGPQPVVVGSFATVDASINFDLRTHSYTIVYGDPPALVKTITGPIPAALLEAIEAHVQAKIERNEGWEAGASSVTP